MSESMKTLVTATSASNANFAPSGRARAAKINRIRGPMCFLARRWLIQALVRGLLCNLLRGSLGGRLFRSRLLRGLRLGIAIRGLRLLRRRLLFLLAAAHLGARRKQ